MKRLLISTVVLALVGSSAMMAQLPELFGWDSHIVQRVGTQITPEGQFRVDTNRYDMTVPLQIGDDPDMANNLVIRGVGQAFAPRYFFPFYDAYYNGESTDPNERDQTYIDQFKGVQSWVLDSVRMAIFHNNDDPNPQNTFGLINVYKMNTDYSKRQTTDSGIVIARETLDNEENGMILIDRQFVMSDLGATVAPNGAIVPTTVNYADMTDGNSNPLGPIEFEKNESAIVMFYNDIANPVTQPIGQDGDARPWERLIGYMEYQDGDGTEEKPFRNPVPRYMVHGLVDRQLNNEENITSTFRALRIGEDTPYLANFNVIWFGSVVLNPDDVPELPHTQSVRYHFGYDAKDQGLATISPNPVRDIGTIPFSLTETANVTIELYSESGEKVATLLNDVRYISGKYTVELKTEGLESGAYLVRMAANDKNYSTKLVIAK